MPRRLLVTLVPATLLLLILLTKGGSGPASHEIPSADLPILGKTLHFIERNYVDPSWLDAKKLYEGAAEELETSVSPLLIKIHEKKIDLSYGTEQEELSAPAWTLDELPGLLRQTLGFLNSNYHGRLESKEREYLAINGMVDKLDPHSNFLPPNFYKEFKIGTKGNFGGLGIVIGLRDGNLTVISPLEETPAWKAGIRAKDRITQIGEESTINMSLTEAVEKLRGPVGSDVFLVIQRAGVPTPLEFHLTRALIQIQSVAGRLLSKKIGLIKIKSFQEDTVESFDRMIRSLRHESPELKGLVLDLRNNPGGLLDQAIHLADRFLNGGAIVKTVGPQTEEREDARAGDPEESLPVVVLVNEGSASASEIVAGAFQDDGRALIVGNQTFGKGTVQTVFDLKDGSALKLTIAKYLTAGDHEVQSVGIQPDIELLPVNLSEKSIDLFEEIKKGEAKKPLQRTSDFRIQYLQTEKKDEEENSVQIPLEEDFPVHLAKQLLELPSAQSNPSSSWLQSTPPLLAQVRKEQEGKIEQSLKSSGIDWSQGPNHGSPKIEVVFSLLDEKGTPLKGLQPGASGKLRLEAENRGTGSLYQFAAVTSAEDPLFSNLEFPLGRLDPGQKREWSTTLKIPEAALPRNEPVELVFHEAYDRLPPTKQINLNVQEVPLPLFAYFYQIDDGKEKGKGNKNGRPEPGETVALKIRIQNRGEAASPEPLVNLKNAGGAEIFIEKGRVSLSPLAPMETGEATFLFRVAKNPADAKKISLELNLQDQKEDRELTDRLSFPLGSNEKPSPPPAEWQIPPHLEVGQLTFNATGSSYLVRGVASDDHQVEHLLFFVGNHKVAYLPSPTGDHPTVPFEMKLPLQAGMNLVTVAAQDDRELTTRKQWIVWRKK